MFLTNTNFVPKYLCKNLTKIIQPHTLPQRAENLSTIQSTATIIIKGGMSFKTIPYTMYLKFLCSAER